ncbi:hypothetical protein [Legionella worsleiensis]|uniref:Protein with a bacterial immunoglobulin-like domain protein n=1 Tax=Legionella worsleiensis TaxID=45076 RepID=A0A0W1AFE8_9GAMM|nr:hypothetical protein [Legionella worsleiensis]KTD80058.1 hypothetical protein Lwor_1572 [Legionella worsleiensis]STY32531.1 Uncharacterised protein [Legionella worsleiensis]
MINKLLCTTLSLSTLIIPFHAYANDDSCEIQIAVSSPPIQPDQNVAFNITNDNGLSKSIILQGGSSPKIIGKLTCSPMPYTVSATLFNTLPNTPVINGAQIGQCTLKAGNISLNGSNNSVSVVFPNDFICNS